MLSLMGGLRVASGDRGFTLIELAVVMIIIAVLAAIAIPVFFRQRDKGLVAQSQSALANAKLAAESHYVGEGGASYEALDGAEIDGIGDEEETIYREGLRVADGVVVLVDASESDYCITAIHFSLPPEPGEPWQTATVSSTSGSPSPENTC